MVIADGRDALGGIDDGLVLTARLLLAALFLIFGWRKLKDFSGTVSQMAELGVPTPILAAAVATFMELPVAFAVAIGGLARLSALLLVFYTLGTALIGHRYWTATGANRVDSMDGFYKNLSIMGGFLLLCVTGAGKYSIDAYCGMATRPPVCCRAAVSLDRGATSSRLRVVPSQSLKDR